jgi:hypothetical protein
MLRSTKTSIAKPLVLAALALGVGLGSYGIASAASGSSSGSGSSAQAAATTPSAPSAPPGASAQNPWGNQRSDETPLTGDTLAQVKAAAVAKVGSGSTIVRVETDADGHAAYEAHMLRSDGTPVTVYVDKSFGVVSVESR